VPYVPGPTVGLVDDTSLVTLPTAEAEAATLLTVDDALVAPSYDRHSLVWTGEVRNAGRLLVVDPAGGEPVEVAAPALTRIAVDNLRVSRDGARIAAIVTAGGQTQILVASIVRDEQGLPVGLGPAQPVGQSLTAASELVWIDEQNLGVLGVAGDSEPTVHVVPIGGPAAALPSIPGIVSLASGRGEHELWLGTSDGALYARSGNSWRRVGEDLTISEPTLPG